jgi:hypothetical protein
MFDEGIASKELGERLAVDDVAVYVARSLAGAAGDQAVAAISAAEEGAAESQSSAAGATAPAVAAQPGRRPIALLPGADDVACNRRGYKPLRPGTHHASEHQQRNDRHELSAQNHSIDIERRDPRNPVTADDPCADRTRGQPCPATRTARRTLPSLTTAANGYLEYSQPEEPSCRSSRKDHRARGARSARRASFPGSLPLPYPSPL